MAGNQDVGLTATAALSEMLSALSLPGSSILQRAVDNAYDRRKQAAIDALIEAVRTVGAENVQFGTEEADEVVQMLLRYYKAAAEGAAKQNLKLLAMAIFGLKKNKTLTFDKFQEFANVLETLTRDEVLFLGKIYSYLRREGNENSFIKYRSTIEDEAAKHDADMIVASLQRHGLFTPSSAFSVTEYQASSKLFDICELASVQKV